MALSDNQQVVLTFCTENNIDIEKAVLLLSSLNMMGVVLSASTLQIIKDKYNKHTTTINNKLFKKELKALLEKYNAYIHFSVSDTSDTYSLYDEELLVTFNTQDNKRISHQLAEGWTVTKSDL